jgi:hypothetical protein
LAGISVSQETDVPALSFLFLPKLTEIEDYYLDENKKLFFEIISDIKNIEPIATQHSIRELKNLQRMYGIGRWRKLKGIAEIQFESGEIYIAEIHWYEAHGIGKKKIKIKRILE